MAHIINSCALTGEKPCINKAIHALLMHGYATFNMTVPGPHICCRYMMCTSRPYKEHSKWKFPSWDISEKAKQNSARNNMKCSKLFQFLCNNSDQKWFLNALTFARSLGRCWKPRPSASVFNTSHRTSMANVKAWKTMFDPYVEVDLFSEFWHCFLSPLSPQAEMASHNWNIVGRGVKTLTQTIKLPLKCIPSL